MEEISVNIMASIMAYLSLPYLVCFIFLAYGLRNITALVVAALTGSKKAMTWGVFIMATILGFVWHFAFGEDLTKLFVTYAVGTSLYELIIQAVINKIKGK